MTALHYACKRGNKDTVSLLLRLDANLNLQNKTGWTALAIASDKGYVDVCKHLIVSKAKVNITVDANGIASRCLATTCQLLSTVYSLLQSMRSFGFE